MKFITTWKWALIRIKATAIKTVPPPSTFPAFLPHFLSLLTIIIVLWVSVCVCVRSKEWIENF